MKCLIFARRLFLFDKDASTDSSGGSGHQPQQRCCCDGKEARGLDIFIKNVVEDTMLRSAQRIPAVFAPPLRSVLARTLGWCSEDETAAALSREFIIMNTKMTKLGAALLALAASGRARLLHRPLRP